VGLFSFGSSGLIGLDLSATAVKIVELGKARRGYELKAIGHVALPRDAIVEDSIVDSMAVSQALLDAIEAAQPSTRDVAIALSGNSVIIKTVQMPAMTEFELENQIEYEADQHIPFDMEEVYLDFQILGASEEEGQMDVVLVACKREVVEDLRLVLAEAGLNLKLVDCAVFAIENAAEITGEHGVPENLSELAPEDAEVHALVNIGATKTNVNISVNGQTAFVRDQFFGGNNLTEEIQKAHGVGHDEAERMKIERFEEVSPDAIEAFYAGLVAELSRALDYYAANHPDQPVKKMLLMGGGALIPGIADELSGRMGIDTIVLNPLDAIEIPEKKFDREHLARVGPMYAVGVGLALRSFDS